MRFGIIAGLCAAPILGYWAVKSTAAPEPAPPVAAPAFDSSKRVAVASSNLPIRTLLRVPGSMRYGQSLWDDKGVAPGKAWVRIDLDAQILSVFRGGHEIGTAVILHGADNKPTPTGRFPVLARLKDHRSSIYDAPMPYTLRLTGDGVAIHGSDVRQGLATNGCIGIPEGFAARLFDAMKVGGEVVIVRGGPTA